MNTRTESKLDKLFIETDTNFNDLHHRLGISKTKLARLKNKPETECDAQLLKKISQLTGKKSIELLETWKLGYNKLTAKEIDDLNLEQSI